MERISPNPSNEESNYLSDNSFLENHSTYKKKELNQISSENIPSAIDNKAVKEEEQTNQSPWLENTSFLTDPNGIKDTSNLTQECLKISKEKVEEQDDENITKLKIIKDEINPKKVTKKCDPEGRKKTAQNIITARQNKRKNKKMIENILKLQEPLQQKIQNEINNIENQIKEKTSQLLSEHNKTGILNRIRTLVGTSRRVINRLELDVEYLRQRQRANYTNSQEKSELRTLESEIDKLIKDAKKISDSKNILKAYYKNALTNPLTKKEKENLLKPEILSSLTTEEYIKLWSRLNPHYLAHTTRQGFRDHFGHIYHTAGEWEYHNNFIYILINQKIIRAHFGLKVVKNGNADSLKKWLERKNIFSYENKETAKKNLEHFLGLTKSYGANYPDNNAVHFSVNLVANKCYGAEKDNEIFFIFPTDFIASQYSYDLCEIGDFNNHQKNDFTDVLVFCKELDSGIPIDAALTFLPNSTLVDPETGSKYISETKIINGKRKRFLIESEGNDHSRKKADSLKNAVTAKDYWEKFFANNPTLKPKHIIYYDGDPTQAVLEFQQANNIGKANTEKVEDKLLGHEKNRTNRENFYYDGRAYPGLDKIIAMSHEMIDEHYKK